MAGPAMNDDAAGSYRTACGGILLVSDATLEHLRAHSDVVPHLRSIARRLFLTRRPMRLAEVSLPVTGVSRCVAAPIVGLDDPIQIVYRNGRRCPSRVVVGQGEITNTVSVVAQQTEHSANTYRLLSAWFGSLAEREPTDPGARGDDFERSLAFWSVNALVHDPDEGPMIETTWRSVLRQHRPALGI